MSGKTYNFTLSVTLEDPGDWEEEFGQDSDDDLFLYLDSAIKQSPAFEFVPATVELKQL